MNSKRWNICAACSSTDALLIESSEETKRQKPILRRERWAFLRAFFILLRRMPIFGIIDRLRVESGKRATRPGEESIYHASTFV